MRHNSGFPVARSWLVWWAWVTWSGGTGPGWLWVLVAIDGLPGLCCGCGRLDARDSVSGSLVVWWYGWYGW